MSKAEFVKTTVMNKIKIHKMYPSQDRFTHGLMRHDNTSSIAAACSAKSEKQTSEAIQIFEIYFNCFLGVSMFKDRSRQSLLSHPPQ